MSKWKSTANHWSKTAKREEVLVKVLAPLKDLPSYWKGKKRGEIDPKTIDALQKGKAEYIQKMKGTVEWEKKKQKLAERMKGNQLAWKNGNATDPIKKKIAQHKNYRKQQLRQYGISEAQYNEMFVAQNGVCAICGEAPEAGKYLAVDHSHETGKVRGLLCKMCNSAIGFFGDDLKKLLRAVEYLSY